MAQNQTQNRAWNIASHLLTQWSREHQLLALSLLRKVPLVEAPIFKLKVPAAWISVAIFVLGRILFLLSLAILSTSIGWIPLIALVVAFYWFLARPGRLSFSRFSIATNLFSLILPGNSFSVAMRISMLLLACGYEWWKQASIQLVRKQFANKPVVLSNINTGSATVMSGDIQIVNLFVNTPSQVTWKRRTQKDAARRTKTAIAWLSRQAEKFGVEVSFQNRLITKSFKYTTAIPQSNSEQSKRIAFKQWIKVQIKEIIRTHKLANTNHAFIVHADHPLRSYAVAQRSSFGPVGECEFAVIGSEDGYLMVAHEILHLFGADDYYISAWFGESFKEPVFREQQLDGCIMFNIPESADDAYVDKVAAENIGWK